MSSTSSSRSDAVQTKSSWIKRLLIGLGSLFFRVVFRSDYTVNRRLMNFLDRKVAPISPQPLPHPPHPTTTTPTPLVSSYDVTNISSSSPDLWFRVYTPHDPHHTHDDHDPQITSNSMIKLPVLIYFHGGGFVFGHPNSSIIDSLTRRLALQLNFIVVSVNYRLAPEHRCPSQYDDGVLVLNFIDDDHNTTILPENADVSRCFLTGESAGANLAHHVAVRAAEFHHDFKTLSIVGLIAIQPFFAAEERTESEIRLKDGPGLTLESADWCWKAFLPHGSDRNHPAANVFGTKDITNIHFPPTLVVIGGLDLLQDSDKKYCEWLRRSGKYVEMVEYPTAVHGFLWFPNSPIVPLLMKDVTHFVQKQLLLPKYNSQSPV